MKNLITTESMEIVTLSQDEPQTWMTPTGNVHITQRLVGSIASYVVVRLGHTPSQNVLTAVTLKGDRLMETINDQKWVEIKDAVICRESDVKTEKLEDEDTGLPFPNGL